MIHIRNHWPKLILILAYTITLPLLFNIKHTQDESISLWDITFASRLTLILIHDPKEGPVFWLTDQGHTLIRWPEHFYVAPPPPGVGNAWWRINCCIDERKDNL